MSFEGNPASVVAWVSLAVVVLSGSNVTVAAFASKSIVVDVTPGTRVSAFLTTTGQVPQVIFSTARVAVCGGAAQPDPVTNSKESDDRELSIE